MLPEIPLLRSVHALRYVTPLREGGSLPAILEADDDGTYVVKFRGAGHGAKALIAELLGAEVARALGLPVPEVTLLTLDPALGRGERDYEIRKLIQASGGLNLAVDYLPGAIGFEAPDRARVDPFLASLVVWFDAYIQNVDRTARNPNLLWWKRSLWLIDHGAAFYFHHDWAEAPRLTRSPFSPVRQHVLLPVAARLPDAAAVARARLPEEVLAKIVALVPDDWLELADRFPDPAGQRNAYLRVLSERIDQAEVFEQEALRARALPV